MNTAALKARIIDEARRLGFDEVRIARADVPLEADFARYEAFVRDGLQGDMAWLAAIPEARRRLDHAHVLEGAKSVVCLAKRYVRTEAEEASDSELARTIARYARGRDYHNGLRKKLRKLAQFVRGLDPEGTISARPLCDEEPVLERAWAARSGLGFVGKNGLLIAPGLGSMVLLGEVVTTLELPADSPIAERCGSCTRCLDACPTEAFVAPFVLDARRCISYLTIEQQGPIDEALRPKIGQHLFGCDDCQTVCPFNTGPRSSGPRAPRGAPPLPPFDPRFSPDPRWSELRVTDLVELDDASFEALREGSPIGRPTRLGLIRNALIVIGNRALPEDAERLEAWARELESDMLRELAAWAARRCRGEL